MVKRLKIFLSGCFCWIALVDTASNLFQKRILMQPSGSAGSGVSMLLYFTALRSGADLKWICEIDSVSMCTWLCSTCFFNATFQCTIKVNVHERLHRPVGSNANRLVRLNQFSQVFRIWLNSCDVATGPEWNLSTDASICRLDVAVLKIWSSFTRDIR